jgi:hypothetical protein
MANCTICKGEMQHGISCSTGPLVIDGGAFEPLHWGDETRFGPVVAGSACKDCASTPGGVHHHGCDVEGCPACHCQAISCRCDERFECVYARPRPRCAVRFQRPNV